MPLAAKHFDLAVGIDLHFVLVPSPSGPVPTPLLLPFTGFVFDVKDYLPRIGATVRIGGLPVARAGASVTAVPGHLSPLGPFIRPPANCGELFMGSATVVCQGEPMGHGGLPVLSCSDVGLPPPKRATTTLATQALLLPTSVLIALPCTAMVGGPPAISSGWGLKILKTVAISKLKGRLAKSELGKRIACAQRRASQRANVAADRVFSKLGVEKHRRLRRTIGETLGGLVGIGK